MDGIFQASACMLQWWNGPRGHKMTWGPAGNVKLLDVHLHNCSLDTQYHLLAIFFMLSHFYFLKKKHFLLCCFICVPSAPRYFQSLCPFRWCLYFPWGWQTYFMTKNWTCDLIIVQRWNCCQTVDYCFCCFFPLWIPYRHWFMHFKLLKC